MFSLFNCLKRVKQLEEEMLKLTRIVESRDLDWQDMRARVKRLLDRTEKAAARITEPQDASEEPAQALQLTPSQRRLQDLVERRRKMLNLNREAS